MLTNATHKPIQYRVYGEYPDHLCMYKTWVTLGTPAARWTDLESIYCQSHRAFTSRSMTNTIEPFTGITFRTVLTRTNTPCKVELHLLGEEKRTLLLGCRLLGWSSGYPICNGMQECSNRKYTAMNLNQLLPRKEWRIDE